MAFSDWLFGRRLATLEEEQQRVGVLAGIPMLGLDALASAAYGPEAALALLIPLGLGGVGHIEPITTLIIVLLMVVYFSYRQTIAAYPSGGGSYTVARENLGNAWGLLAAAALMLDYVLVVAVGVSAGIGALVSAPPGLPALHRAALPADAGPHHDREPSRREGVGCGIHGADVPLRRHALIGAGHRDLQDPVRRADIPRPLHPPAPLSSAPQVATIWLLMRSFASGCTAMTGVEAVSNGVSAFREPSVLYARRTLTAIIVLLAVLLAGIAFLCSAYGIGATRAEEAGYQSVLSQLTAAVVGRGVFYYITIASVLAVLALSANTGFADFPRLCRVVAQDGYLPNAFAHRGRRLVYSHGILVLAVLSGLLLVVFRGITDALIPLFAVGAFLAFTLSQAGMVVHWRRAGGPGSGRSMAINGVGAICTAVTLVVVLVSKFTEGAWVTVFLVPVLLILFVGVRGHYRNVAREVSSDTPLDASHLEPPIALLPIRGWSAITRKALRVAMKISPEVYVLHIAGDERTVLDLEDTWVTRVRQPSLEAGVEPPRLIVIFSPFRQLYAPLMEAVTDIQKAHPGRDVAVIIPELVATRWYHYLLHNQTAAVIKAYLLFSGLRRVFVLNVPWYLAG